ncbi:ABC transporter ATP-binding protein [Micromonospora eburnea]|uniref:ATP-binding cassette, subfamily B n=1 Tax=Micromonospora eburnea TaxID=227316 RepID=A0A1C6UXD0_9ACTN|nr:ABC transporter ATP-binding protein [Micromonospora eburnea]SCL58459.1 ATP-binding cassette, subfamily B [Micromonospora eburnea]
MAIRIGAPRDLLRQLTGSSLARLVALAPASIAGTAIWAVSGVAVTLALPSAAATAIDRVTGGGAPGSALVLLAGLIAIRVLIEAMDRVTETRAVTRIAARLRHRFTRHLFRLGVPGRTGHHTGDLLTRLTGNTAAGARGVPSLITVAVETAASLGGLIALTVIDWWLGAAFLLGVAPAVGLLRVLMRQVRGRYGDYLRHQGDIAARLTDTLAGIRTIRASGTADREIARVLAPLPALARTGHQTWRVQRDISWQLDVVLTGLRTLVLGIAGFGLVQGRITPGEFLAASLYLGFALGFLYQSDTLAYLAHAQANAGRVTEILDERPRGRAAPPGTTLLDRLPATGPGRLSLRQVSVTHDGHRILDRVDLDVPAGATVALVGPSGAGKTTLAMVAGRLVDPDEGEVRIDGVRVDRVTPAGLRGDIGYAFDQPVLLGDTVRDAITYGRPDAADEDGERAARIAQATDFVERLPAGFDTPLSQVPLSGGELQRLGLARAVAHGGRIMILDDATSSLDTATEARVTAALTSGLAGRTRLVVAHRAATAARADTVAWLEGGRIRAVGPHGRLWADHPEYRSVFAAGAAERRSE